MLKTCLVYLNLKTNINGNCSLCFQRMEEAAAYEAENPFISGDRIHTVAKKGLQYQDM